MEAESGRLTFAAGETSGTISVRVRDDALDEADETFTVILSAPKNARFDGGTVSATGTIIDNDDPPALTIADASAKESAGEIAFRVSLDAPSGREVAVSYRTEDGTAKAGEDYGATDGDPDDRGGAGPTPRSGSRWRTNFLGRGRGNLHGAAAGIR